MEQRPGNMCEYGRIVASLCPGLLREHPAKVFVETGTGWGGGLLVALCTGMYREIHSIEAEVPCHDAAKELFKGNPAVRLYFGSSAVKLAEILATVRERALIWLDAHSPEEPNPLFDELRAVAAHPVKDHCLMVDDRRMWGSSYRCWQNVGQEAVVAAVKAINPAYGISWADSWNAPQDILVADVPGRGK